MIEAKRLKSLIGQGVAIKCPNGPVKKFKVLAIKMTLDKDGERLNSVKLDIPGSLIYTFHGCSMRNKDLMTDGIWVYPEFLYRNKGECARHLFEKKLKQAAELEAKWRKIVSPREKELETCKKTLQEAVAEREKLEAAYKKSKFARTAVGKR